MISRSCDNGISALRTSLHIPYKATQMVIGVFIGNQGLLRQAPYLNLGRNLFTPSDLDGVHGFSASARYVATQTSAALKGKPSISFPLSPSEGLLLGKAEQSVEDEKFGPALAYKDLIDWITRKQLQGGVANSL